MLQLRNILIREASGKFRSHLWKRINEPRVGGMLRLGFVASVLDTGLVFYLLIECSFPGGRGQGNQPSLFTKVNKMVLV